MSRNRDALLKALVTSVLVAVGFAGCVIVTCGMLGIPLSPGTALPAGADTIGPNSIDLRVTTPRPEIGLKVSREVVIVLPADVDEVLSGDNGKNGVVVCYRSTKGGERMVQYSGPDYRDVTIFYLGRRK